MLQTELCPTYTLPTIVQQRDMLKGGKESYGVAEERQGRGNGGPRAPRAPIRSRVLMFGNHKAASGRLGTRKEGECWARHSRREGETPTRMSSRASQGISLVAVRCLIPVGSRVKKMISDSWRADLAEEIHSLSVFLGISEATGKWGGSM